MNIPLEYEAILRAHLHRLKMLDCYERNMQDFINEVGLIYADHKNSPFADELEGPGGFNLLLKAVLKSFKAAPTQRNIRSVDEKGMGVNVFGDFLLRHLPQLPSMQDLLATNGAKIYETEWNIIKDFTGYVVIQALKSGVEKWSKQDFDQANERKKELLSGSRELRYRSFFC